MIKTPPKPTGKVGYRFLSLEALGLAIAGMTLVAAVLYRTYAIVLKSPWMELTRQIDLLFVLIEIAVIFICIGQGLNVRACFSRLERGAKIALVLFLSTFWIGSVIASKHPQFSIVLAEIWIIHILFAAALFRFVGEVSEKSIERLAVVMAGGLLLLAPLIAIHFLFPPSGILLPTGMFTWGVAIPGFISGRLFGAFCGAVLALLVSIAWIASNNGRTAWWHYALITLVSAMVIWSGTRAAVLGVICALGTMAALFPLRIERRFVFATLTSFLIAAVIATLLLPYNDPYFVLFAAKDMVNASAASGGRISLWLAMIDIFARFPLFGSGGGSSAWLAPPGVFAHIQPHNAIIQFLLSWGLIGALPAFYLFARATWLAHRIVASRPHLLPILTMLDTLLMMSMLDGMLYFNRFLMLVFLSYAIIFAAVRDDKTAPSG